MKALLTIDHSEGVPKYLVTPEVLSAPTPQTLVDGVGTASLIPYYIRATINPGNDVVAADRLKAGYPDVITIFPDNAYEFDVSNALKSDGSPAVITDLYWIAVGNTSAGPLTASPANYTGNAFIVAETETDANDWLAQMQHQTIAESAVCRRLKIKTGPVVATNYMHVNCEEGASYA
jgi:hypothetical protein